MKYLIGLLLVFIDIIFQQSIIFNNFYILIIFLILLSSDDKKAIVFVFLAGMVVDLIGGTSLGRSSFGLLIGWGMIYLYRRRFSLDNTLVLLVLFYLLYFCSIIIGNKSWYVSELVVYGLLILILTFFTPWLMKNQQGRLKL